MEIDNTAFLVRFQHGYYVCHCGAWNTGEKVICYMCGQPLMDDGKHFQPASAFCTHCHQPYSLHNEEKHMACPVERDDRAR